MRKFIVAANWKMNKTVAESLEFVSEFKDLIARVKETEIVLCPSFMALPEMRRALGKVKVMLGAQNLYFKLSGAFTGEVSPLMVAEFCEYVIIGHSDRRHIFGEKDAELNKKLKAALANNLIPIFCIGEVLEERKAGKMEEVLERQIRKGFEGVSGEDAKKVVIAYEPVWAISRGDGGVKPATNDDIITIHKYIRELLEKVYSKDVADAVTVQYGGSVKPENAKEIFALPNVDGGLVGGASLEPASFAEIVKAR